MSNESVTKEITAAFAGLRAALLAKDRPELEAIHDPDFKATELHGQLMTAEEHIGAAMVGGDLEMEFLAIDAMDLGHDLAIAWGRQSLKGFLRPEDVTPAVSAEVQEGIVFVFTAVWRKWPDRWKVLTYHVSTLPKEA